tara:strand:+ start:233 stop:541 length:309 start_codon:yes stop_codon:yes gene_type:complete
MTTQHAAPAVGYSILRTGSADAFEACIVLPHVEQPRALHFDPISRRLEVIAGVASVSLPEIPSDVAHLLANAPSRVTVVTTDSLSAVRFSARADELVASQLH